MVLAPWCNEDACEEKVKNRSGAESKENLDEKGEQALTGSAKSLCKPLEQEPIKEG